MMGVTRAVGIAGGFSGERHSAALRFSDSQRRPPSHQKIQRPAKCWSIIRFTIYDNVLFSTAAIASSSSLTSGATLMEMYSECFGVVTEPAFSDQLYGLNCIALTSLSPVNILTV
jgi:hypothetical protein